MLLRLTVAWLPLGALLAVSCADSNSEPIVIGPSSAQTYSRARSDAGHSKAAELNPRILRRFAPLERWTSDKALELIDLGRMLYYDRRLSQNGQISCNSCHPLDRYGATSTRFSVGVDGQMGTRNAPSTYHAAGHFTQFWDGREETIEEQAKGPIQNPVEMGMTPANAVATLKAVPGYGAAFQKAFPSDADPITFDHIAMALGAFQRGLMTPAPWDDFLRGNHAALNADEVEGAKLFSNLGCIVCHTGPYIGGSMFEKLGARIAWPSRGDLGRGKVTGNTADEGVFKVPSLRNVARTGPYFHDGSTATLEEAVQLMAHHQLGVDLERNEIRQISAWLSSLTGRLPETYIARPVLPGEKSVLQ